MSMPSSPPCGLCDGIVSVMENEIGHPVIVGLCYHPQDPKSALMTGRIYVRVITLTMDEKDARFLELGSSIFYPSIRNLIYPVASQKY